MVLLNVRVKLNARPGAGMLRSVLLARVGVGRAASTLSSSRARACDVLTNVSPCSCKYSTSGWSAARNEA